jgi:hypothetical protein
MVDDNTSICWESVYKISQSWVDVLIVAIGPKLVFDQSAATVPEIMDMPWLYVILRGS